MPNLPPPPLFGLDNDECIIIVYVMLRQQVKADNLPIILFVTVKNKLTSVFHASVLS